MNEQTRDFQSINIITSKIQIYVRKDNNIPCKGRTATERRLQLIEDFLKGIIFWGNYKG